MARRRRLKIGTNFQREANTIGRETKERCETILQQAGFVILGDKEGIATPVGTVSHHSIVETVGVKPTIVALRPQGVGAPFQNVLFFDTKGGEHTKLRPGLRRTDSLKKSAFDGALLSNEYNLPYIILTTGIPTAGSNGEKMLRIAVREGWVADVININEPDDVDRLQEWLTTNPLRTWGFQIQVSPFSDEEIDVRRTESDLACDSCSDADAVNFVSVNVNGVPPQILCQSCTDETIEMGVTA